MAQVSIHLQDDRAGSSFVAKKFIGNEVVFTPGILNVKSLQTNDATFTTLEITDTETFKQFVVDNVNANELVATDATGIKLQSVPYANTPIANTIVQVNQGGTNVSWNDTNFQTLHVLSSMFLGTGALVDTPSSKFILSNGPQTINGQKTLTTQVAIGQLSLNNITLTSSVSSRIYSLQDVVSSDFIMGVGNQTISGNIVLNPIVANQLILGTGQTVTIATTTLSSHTYTFQDIVSSSFILTQLAQTLNGVKTFGTQIAILTTTNQFVLGTGQTVTLNALAPSSSHAYSFEDIATANFVLTELAQTINGAKTFGNTLTITPVTNQFILGTVQTVTLNAVAPSSSRTYSIQDAGGAANFVFTELAQTINGAKTFGTQLIIPPVTNQLVLGTTNTVTISAVAPSVSRTYSIQDAGASANFVMSEGTQTINGLKTFSSTIIVKPSSNQLVLGTTNTLTITTSPAGAVDIYTIQDALTNADFFMTEGNQTINASYEFTAVGFMPRATANQLILGTTNTTTIQVPAPAASRTHTLSDAKADSFAVLSTQTTASQSGSITTTVVVNAPSIVLTTQSATAAAGLANVFTVTNSFVTAASVILCKLGTYSGAYLTNGIPYPRITSVGSGTFNISVFNIHATTALSGTLVLYIDIC